MRKFLLPVLMCAAMLRTPAATAADDRLAAGFHAPPASAQPRVWWHWMNGNITKSGIDADFAWMKRVGIGGVQNFDAAFNTPSVVDKRLPFLSPEWRATFQHAVNEADRLGLEFTIAGSPGWSETGGPWVKPEQAMKKLVWSETTVQGGAPLHVRLAPPPAVSGPYQDIPATEGAVGEAHAAIPAFYRDIAVVAYRSPAIETSAPKPGISASSPIDLAALMDGDRTRRIELPFDTDNRDTRGESWVMFDYGQPQTVRALTFVAARAGGFGEFGSTYPEAALEASDDGQAFHTLINLPRTGAPEQTVAFRPATARYFRVRFRARMSEPPAFGPPRPPPKSHALAELRLETAPRIHRFQDKAGWSAGVGVEDQPTPTIGAEEAIARNDVVDLSNRLRADGSLDWTPPSGRWTVLRFGWSLTGRQNHPASPEGTGLEVDKLNREYVRAYANAYLGEYEKSVGRELMGKRGVQYMLTDSWEAGSQNWTDDMFAEFKSRRGYELRSWLPVLTGRILDSSATSERFLWDYRRTLGELIEEEHYGELAHALRERGMGLYAESHENNRIFLADGMRVKSYATVPMGAMWATPNSSTSDRPYNYDADIRESASVAHVYGQNIAAAESFTASAVAAYAFSPERLKPLADRMMSQGLNRFVIHTSVHQPVDQPGPGVGLGPFGQWFTRKETWADMAGPWLSYLSRSSYLLQQGRFAADLAWFYGEDSNITALYGSALPDPPNGYAYDFINADALLTRMSVKNGRLVTPSGMSYRVLVLDRGARRLTLRTLRKIRQLVAAGAVVAGARPQETPSLADDQTEWMREVDALWSGTAQGKGRVFADIATALQYTGVSPQVVLPANSPSSFVHRILPDGELFFIVNHGEQPLTFDASFRVTGKAPELWRADTGSIAPLSYRRENGRTVTPLRLAAHDAVFVVFKQSASVSQRTVAEPVVTPLFNLDGAWTVRFAADKGGPDTVTFDTLRSWTDNPNLGVKYYSGVATYERSFFFDSPAHGRVVLDLGSVKNVAEVRLNDRIVGVTWKAPFQIDITDALRNGENELEIRVANLWPNRMIGDKQPGAEIKYAWATFDAFRANSPLLPSGLLGPVQLLQIAIAPERTP